jgi:hypothetical protein
MPDFAIIPVLDIPEGLVLDYWQRVDDAGLLADRWCDLKDPSPMAIIRLLREAHYLAKFMFMLFREDKGLVAEFTLTNFTGKAAMVHFSMAPENSPQESMHYARATTDIVLNEWGDGDQPDAPFLYSLYGLTPTTNKAACAFVRRVGFKKVGILPKGQKVKGSEAVDAMITIKERSNGR